MLIYSKCNDLNTPLWFIQENQALDLFETIFIDEKEK